MAQLDFTDWHADKFRQARASAEQPTALTYLGLLAYHLTPSLAAGFCERLRLTNAEDETIMQLLALRAESEPRLAPPRLRRVRSIVCSRNIPMARSRSLRWQPTTNACANV